VRERAKGSPLKKTIDSLIRRKKAYLTLNPLGGSELEEGDVTLRCEKERKNLYEDEEAGGRAEVGERGRAAVPASGHRRKRTLFSCILIVAERRK